MDAIRLKNSCICGNTRPYVECCGVYAVPPDSGNADESEILVVARGDAPYFGSTAHKNGRMAE